jgi:L-amino acid N-acyltransferase YncA
MCLVEKGSGLSTHPRWSCVHLRLEGGGGASRTLLRTLGFREVGMYERHGKLDGLWRDVVIVEPLL